MTLNQQSVLDRLRRSDHRWIAEETERAWKNGETYYIDTRVSVSQTLRRDFTKGNCEALSMPEANQ